MQNGGRDLSILENLSDRDGRQRQTILRDQPVEIMHNPVVNAPGDWNPQLLALGWLCLPLKNTAECDTRQRISFG